jgi:Tfp pilus assembly PilM family ATPase
MLGGGATIAGIDQRVAEQLELETNVWQLPASRLSPSLRCLRQQPLFAAAIGLSVPG